MWTLTAAFLGATALAVGAMGITWQLVPQTTVIVPVGLCIGLVAFNLVEVVLFRTGILRLTNVNADDPLAAVSLSPGDEDALAKAEAMARAKNYAGNSRPERAAQAKQLRETIDLAKSLRSGTESEPEQRDVSRRDVPRDTPRTTSPSTTSAPVYTPQSATPAPVARPRCRFRQLLADNQADVRRMSALATGIVREHFDPIIGPEQNDYMISRFQTPDAIAAQLNEGFEYYYVYPPKGAQPAATADGQRDRVRPIGFVAVQAQDAGQLYLSKFYLSKEERGRGYARSMMGLVVSRARKLNCDHVTLHVNRNNYQAILAYEHLGFKRVGEVRTNIGSGYVMDDFVYELTL